MGLLLAAAAQDRFGFGAPDDAIAVALRGHVERGGSAAAKVSRATSTGDCAVVELADPGKSLTSVAVIKRADRWEFGRESSEDDFDGDDVGDRAACWRIATSTGPLVNGGAPATP